MSIQQKLWKSENMPQTSLLPLSISHFSNKAPKRKTRAWYLLFSLQSSLKSKGHMLAAKIGIAEGRPV